MTNQLRINNIELEGVKFTPRTNSLNSFYAKALKLQREYAKFESVFIDSDLVKAVIANKDENDPDYIYNVEELMKQKYLCRELFLTTDLDGNASVKNAELLTDVMLVEPVEHTKERNEAEFLNYIDFLMQLLTDFFQKFNPLRHLSSQLTNIRKAIESETNSQTTS